MRPGSSGPAPAPPPAARRGRAFSFPALLACAALLLAGPAPAEPLLRPGLVPPGAVWVLNAPDCAGLLGQLDATPLGPLLVRLGPLSQGLTAAPDGLLRGRLDAVELALGPSPEGVGPPLFFLSARVRDAQALRAGLERLETGLRAAAAESLGRSSEGIGQARLVILRDATASLGWMLEGEQALFAFSNHPESLRRAARRIASEALLEEVPEGWAPALRAWAQLSDAGPGPALRFLARAPLPARGLPWNDAAPEPARTGRAAWLRVEADALRWESFRLHDPEAPDLAARLAEEAPYLDAAPAPAGGLLCAASSLYDGERLGPVLAGLLREAEGRRAGQGSALLIGPEADPARAWSALRRRLEGEGVLRPFGPEAWLVLESVAFGPPGSFPDLDLRLGLTLREAAAASARLEELEAALLEAGRRALADSGGDALALAVEQETGPGGAVTRNFHHPAWPAGLAPGWCVAPGGGRALFALSPEDLRRALGGAAPPDPQWLEAQERLGMERCHTRLSLRCVEAAPLAEALLFAWAARQAEPEALEPFVAGAGALMRAFSRLDLFRRAAPGGMSERALLRFVRPPGEEAAR